MREEITRQKKEVEKNMNEGKKLFGKYNELCLLVLGFLLTGIVGTYINNRFQYKTWERQKKEVLLSTQTEIATKLFENVSDLMHERMYATWQIVFAFEDTLKFNKYEREKRWDTYKEVLRKWNMNRGFNREMLRFYFGNTTYQTERNIHYDFRFIGQILECIKNNSRYSMIDSVRTISNQLNKTITGFNINAIKLIHTGKIGESKEISNGIKKDRKEFECKN